MSLNLRQIELRNEEAKAGFAEILEGKLSSSHRNEEHKALSKNWYISKKHTLGATKLVNDTYQIRNLKLGGLKKYSRFLNLRKCLG